MRVKWVPESIKPARRKKAKMTFILGMRCSDGIAIFADTLESGGVVKRYRQKVHSENFIAGWGIAWGVAGNALVADKFSQKLREVLNGDVYDRQKIELLIEQCLKWIRKQYSGPEEDIDVIVGMFGFPRRAPKSLALHTRIPEAHLYRADSLSACLSPVKDHYAIGMDVTLALFIVENMRNPFGFIDEAIRLGVLTTAVMKKYANHVGGDTNGFVYRIESARWVPLLECEIAQIEKDFPVSDVEECATAFWRNHPKARNDDEMQASQLHVENAHGKRSRRSAFRKSKPEL